MSNIANCLGNRSSGSRAETPIEGASEQAPKYGSLAHPAVPAQKPSGFSAAPRRVALYARVSTHGQTAENQLRELRAVADRSGWIVVQTFCDTVSGTKEPESRPGFANLLRAIARHEVDVLAVWALDRLSRSLRELLGVFDMLNKAGVDLFSHRQALDTGSASGRMLISLVGVFAEFERDLLVERVRAGLARAKAQGKRIGRPRTPERKAAEVREALLAGRGIHTICRNLGIGSATVQRIRREMIELHRAVAPMEAGGGVG
jgi:DNA invertase Pin-like site-specific DNA recombinase